jgi:hypothetical protein
LGSSSVYIGTTAIALNRGSAAQALTGITSIDGSAATLTTARTINGVSFNGSANITLTANPTSNIIAASTDLNSIQTPGIYYCPANVTVATLVNCPTANAFGMVVIQSAGYIQFLHEYPSSATAKYWVRNYYNAVWGPWTRILKEDAASYGISITGNAATVTTNANLTGDITSVGNATTLTDATATGKLLTGYAAGTNTALAATDSILGAFGKVQAQINARPGTVTSVSVVSANGISGTVATATSTPAITLTLGALTGTSFNSITGLSTASPLMDGTATVGTSTLVAREGHIHPTDTSRQAAYTLLTTFGTLANASGVLSNNGAGVLSWVAGGGTVTSVSTAAANNGVTATWATATTTPALTIGLSNITPITVSTSKLTTTFRNTDPQIKLTRATPTTDSHLMSFGNGVAVDYLIGRQANSDDLVFGTDNGAAFTERVRFAAVGTSTFVGAITTNDTLTVKNVAYIGGTSTSYTSLINLQTAGSSNWRIGIGDSGGTNFGITCDFGTFTINKTSGLVTTPGAYTGNGVNILGVESTLKFDTTGAVGSNIIQTNADGYGMDLYMGRGTTCRITVGLGAANAVAFNGASLSMGALSATTGGFSSSISATTGTFSSYITSAANRLTASTDLNTRTLFEIFDVNTPVNGAVAGTWNSVMNWPSNDTNYITQLANAMVGTGEIYRRAKVTGTWGSWYKLIDTSNFTAQALTSSQVFTAIASQNNTDWYRTTGNVGVYFSSWSAGLYATSSQLVQTYNSSSLQVNGTLYATGDVIAYYTSDKRLKENIKPIENAIDKVKRLNGVSYNWNQLYLNTIPEPLRAVNNKRDIGLIAQEVEMVLPELVVTKDTGYKGLKYDRIVALLVEAIKEQQLEIDELKKRIK